MDQYEIFLLNIKTVKTIILNNIKVFKINSDNIKTNVF